MLIALLHPSERHHQAVVATERRVRREFRRWVVPELFLAEVHAFGLRRVGRERADAGIRQLLMSSRVELAYGSPQVHAATVDLLGQYQDVPLSYADAAGLAIARGRGITDAFTLDQRWSACGITVLGLTAIAR